MIGRSRRSATWKSKTGRRERHTCSGGCRNRWEAPVAPNSRRWRHGVYAVRKASAKLTRIFSRHSREGGNPAVVARMPGLAPAGDLLSCSCKKVGKEARPAAPALRATLVEKGSPGRSLNSLRSDNATGIPRRTFLHSAEQRGRQSVARDRPCQKDQKVTPYRCAQTPQSICAVLSAIGIHWAQTFIIWSNK